MRISREDRSRFTEWWFTADHALFAAAIALVIAGIVLSLAASPSAALRKGLPAFIFVERHFKLALAGVAVLWLISLLSPAEVRRLASGLFAASCAGLAAVLLTGAEINGARRWLQAGGFSLQPSEFMKPAFIVLSAWLLAEARERPSMPALPLAFALLAAAAGLLVLEPDVGQTVLIVSAWLAMFFMSGQPVAGALALFLCGAGGIACAYFTFGHVRGRFDRFLNPGDETTSQTGRALHSFLEGGFFGRGPGEGTVKTVLPDAHTDFVFAVMAEEFGALACLLLLGLFAFVTVRAFAHARAEPSAANRLAIAGLALVFSGQALINMAVNVGLLPPKGITLPFVSAGGSSLLATSITFGMLLALTRRRPGPGRLAVPAAGPDGPEEANEVVWQGREPPV